MRRLLACGMVALLLGGCATTPAITGWPAVSVTASGDSLSQWWKGQFTLEDYLERLKHVPRVESAVIQDAGHMLHHDQPQVLAALLERFFAD